MVDRITVALDNGDDMTGPFLDFHRPMIRWTMGYHITRYLIMEMEELHLIGSEVTYLIRANPMHTAVFPQLQHQKTVVFPKDRSMVHCCF